MWFFRFGGCTFPRVSGWNWKTYHMYLSYLNIGWEKLFSNWKRKFAYCVLDKKSFTDFSLGILSEEKRIPTLASSRMQRRGTILTGHNQHWETNALKNVNADCLSRLPNSKEKEVSILENNVYLTELHYSPVKSRRALFLVKFIEFTQFSRPKNNTDKK